MMDLSHRSLERRQRYFRKCCPVDTIVQDLHLFHGTPLYGLDQMLKQGIEPMSHGEYYFDAFCTSINDNMLRMFSEDEGVTGLEFYCEDLVVRRLDNLHAHLMTDVPDLHEISEIEELKAERLEYDEDPYSKGGRYMSEQTSRLVIPIDTDALIAPYFCRDYSYNDEAEVTILLPGCRKLDASIVCVWIHGEQYELEDARIFLQSSEELQASFENYLHAAAS